jgi:hypothetical protein
VRWEEVGFDRKRRKLNFVLAISYYRTTAMHALMEPARYAALAADVMAALTAAAVRFERLISLCQPTDVFSKIF